MRRCRAPDRPLVSPGMEPDSTQGPGTGPRPVGVCGRRDEPVGDAVLHTNSVDLQLHRSGASGHRAPRQTGFAHGQGSAHRHAFESNRFQWAIQSQPDGKNPSTRRVWGSAYWLLEYPRVPAIVCAGPTAKGQIMRVNDNVGEIPVRARAESATAMWTAGTPVLMIWRRDNVSARRATGDGR